MHVTIIFSNKFTCSSLLIPYRHFSYTEILKQFVRVMFKVIYPLFQLRFFWRLYDQLFPSNQLNTIQWLLHRIHSLQQLGTPKSSERLLAYVRQDTYTVQSQFWREQSIIISHFEEFCGLLGVTKLVDPLSDFLQLREPVTHYWNIYMAQHPHKLHSTRESYSAQNRNLTLDSALWHLFTAKRGPRLDILRAFLWDILD